MSDQHKPPAYYPHHAPVPANTSVSLPSLPTNAGGLRIGTATSLARKDAEFIRAHADKFRAETDRTHAVGELIDARLALVPRLVALQHLDEIAHNAYLQGRADREQALAMQALQHELAQEQLLSQIMIARHHTAQYTPTLPTLPRVPQAPTTASTQPPPTSPPAGLTPEDLDTIIAQMPDISSEARAALLRLAKAAAAERGG